MSDVSSVVNYFPTPNEGFATTLGNTIAAGAAIVPLASTSGLVNGSIFVGIIEPGATIQEVFTGTVDTGDSEITGCVWTRTPSGGSVLHTAGVAIVDYVTGTAMHMISAGILKQHTQAGAHIGITNTGGLSTDTITTSGNASVAGTLGVTGELTASGGITGPTWNTWTPTWTNLTIGNATVRGRSFQIGKLVFFDLSVTFGSGTSMGTNPAFSLPVTAATVFSDANAHTLGHGGMALNGGSAVSFCLAQFSDVNNAVLSLYRTDLSSASFTSVTSAVPFTWTTSSIIEVQGFYEAA